MYQDLSTPYDWPVEKSHCQFANQVERKFETHSGNSLSPLGAQNKDIGAVVTNRGYIPREGGYA